MGCGRGWSDAKSKTEHAQQAAWSVCREAMRALVELPI